MSSEHESLLAEWQEVKNEYALPRSVIDAGNLYHYACVFEKIIESQAAEIERLKKEREWLPIESAPKDGTQIQIAHFGERIVTQTDSWNGEWWWRWEEGEDYLEVTHWLPLPEAPKEG